MRTFIVDAFTDNPYSGNPAGVCIFDYLLPDNLMLKIAREIIVSLPICNIQLKAKRPNNKPYPKELITYGDHIRKKRLDLNLSQPQVAKIINVTTDSITNWELNRSEPSLTQIPKIILFLEYTPSINENPIKKYRIEKGISQKN